MRHITWIIFVFGLTLSGISCQSGKSDETSESTSCQPPCQKGFICEAGECIEQSQDKRAKQNCTPTCQQGFECQDGTCVEKNGENKSEQSSGWKALNPVGTLESKENVKIRSAAAGKPGTVFVAGSTKGDLAGKTNKGKLDGFVAKYSKSGGRGWLHLIATPESEEALDVATDGNGNVYVTGYIESQWAGKSPKGGGDIFVAKYDTSSGDRKKVALHGGDGPKGFNDKGTVIAALPSGGYVVGGIFSKLDPYHSVAKYNPDGSREWASAIWSECKDSCLPRDIDVDKSGTIYLGGGETNLGVGSETSYVQAYQPSGESKWLVTKEPEADSPVKFELATAIEATEDAVYVAGHTSPGGDGQGTSAADGREAWIAKLDPSSGKDEWSRKFGATSKDSLYGLAVIGPDEVYAGGNSLSGITIEKNIENFKKLLGGFAAKFRSSNEGKSFKGFELAGFDFRVTVRDLTADNQGNVFVAGWHTAKDENNQNGFVGLLKK